MTVKKQISTHCTCSFYSYVKLMVLMILLIMIDPPILAGQRSVLGTEPSPLNQCLAEQRSRLNKTLVFYISANHGYVKFVDADYGTRI